LSRTEGKIKKQKVTRVTPTAIVLHASLIRGGMLRFFGSLPWMTILAIKWRCTYHSEVANIIHMILFVFLNLIFLFTKLSYYLQWHPVTTKWPHLNDKRASESKIIVLNFQGQWSNILVEKSSQRLISP